MRRKTGNYIKLQSGHILFYKGNENTNNNIDDVGNLINIRQCQYVERFRAIFERIIYITLQLNKSNNIKIIQA